MPDRDRNKTTDLGLQQQYDPDRRQRYDDRESGVHGKQQQIVLLLGQRAERGHADRRSRVLRLHHSGIARTTRESGEHLSKRVFTLPLPFLDRFSGNESPMERDRKRSGLE